MKDYLIKLSDAIAALGEKPLVWVGTEYELGLQKQWQLDINALKRLPPAQSEIIRCKYCRHNHDCNIQYHAQAGEEFYCGVAERRIDGKNQN